MVETPADTRRAGFVAIIGAPNAGKSTLVNALLGQKIAIVTHKAQTTRRRLRGILQLGDAQVVLEDTPGLFQHKPRTALDHALLDEAWQAVAGADLVLWLVDAVHKPTADATASANSAIAQRVKALHKPCALLLNKVDALPDKGALLPMVERWQSALPFTHTLLVSARKSSGLQDVKKVMAEAMPAGEWLYPPDQVADATLREMAAEITREKLFLTVHQEVPYALKVNTETWEEKRGSIHIRQCITVQRPSQKAIVLGRGGQTLKIIGTRARQDIAAMTGQPAHLFLHVRVQADWQDRQPF